MRDWILAWRVRPEHDVRVIETPAAVELDPSSFGPDAPEGGQAPGAKVVIDATRKWHYPGISLPPLEKLREVAADWESYGLPPLEDLKLPRGE